MAAIEDSGGEELFFVQLGKGKTGTCLVEVTVSLVYNDETCRSES